MTKNCQKEPKLVFQGVICPMKQTALFSNYLLYKYLLKKRRNFMQVLMFNLITTSKFLNLEFPAWNLCLPICCLFSAFQLFSFQLYVIFFFFYENSNTRLFSFKNLPRPCVSRILAQTSEKINHYCGFLLKIFCFPHHYNAPQWLQISFDGFPAPFSE